MTTPYKYTPIANKTPVPITMKSSETSANFGDPSAFATKLGNNKNTEARAAKFTMTDREITYMDELIVALLKNTKDKRTDHQKNPIAPTREISISNIKAAEPFTSKFLKLIDDILIRINIRPAEILDAEHLWGTIGQIIKDNGGYKWIDWKVDYYPSNTFFFLFLANIYCNLLSYIDQYYWLEFFLKGIELGAPPITGNFHINKNLHSELFVNCPLGIAEKNNMIIKDEILSNTTLEETIKLERKDRPAASASASSRQTFSVPKIPANISMKSKSQHKHKCRDGILCKSYIRYISGTPSSRDIEHVGKYSHEDPSSGGRKTRRKHKRKRKTHRRKSYRPKKTIKRK